MIEYLTNEIEFEAACREEYERYRARTDHPLPYLEWKYREERKAEVGGLLLA